MTGLEKFVDLDVQEIILDYKIEMEQVDAYNKLKHQFLTEYRFHLFKEYDLFDLDIYFSYPMTKESEIKKNIINRENVYFHDEHEKLDYINNNKFPDHPDMNQIRKDMDRKAILFVDDDSDLDLDYYSDLHYYSFSDDKSSSSEDDLHVCSSTTYC